MLTRLLLELALTSFEHLGMVLNLLATRSETCMSKMFQHLLPDSICNSFATSCNLRKGYAPMSASQSATRSQNKCKFERLFSKVKNCRLLGGTAPGKLMAAFLMSDSWETSFRVSVLDASAVCMKLFTCKLRSATWTDASSSSLDVTGQPWPLPACSTRRKFSWLRLLLKPELHFGHDTCRELMQIVCGEMMQICPESSRFDDSVHARIKKVVKLLVHIIRNLTPSQSNLGHTSPNTARAPTLHKAATPTRKVSAIQTHLKALQDLRLELCGAYRPKLQALQTQVASKHATTLPWHEHKTKTYDFDEWVDEGAGTSWVFSWNAKVQASLAQGTKVLGSEAASPSRSRGKISEHQLHFAAMYLYVNNKIYTIYIYIYLHYTTIHDIITIFVSSDITTKSLNPVLPTRWELLAKSRTQ